MRAFFTVVGVIVTIICLANCVVSCVNSFDGIQNFDAAVGECVTGDMSREASKVDCGDPAAQRRVVGREIKPAPVTEQMLNEVCSAYPTGEEIFYRTLAGGGQVLILCMEPIRRQQV